MSDRRRVRRRRERAFNLGDIVYNRLGLHDPIYTRNPHVYGLGEHYYYYPRLGSEMFFSSPIHYFIRSQILGPEMFQEWATPFIEHAYEVKRVLRDIVNEEQSRTGPRRRFWKVTSLGFPKTYRVPADVNMTQVLESRYRLPRESFYRYYYKFTIVLYTNIRNANQNTNVQNRQMVRILMNRSNMNVRPIMISTPFLKELHDIDLFISNLIQTYRSKYTPSSWRNRRAYQLMFSVVLVAPRAIRVRGAQTRKLINEVSDRYFIETVGSSKNCLFKALQLCLNRYDSKYLFGPDKKKRLNLLNVAAYNLKTRIMKKKSVISL